MRIIFLLALIAFMLTNQVRTRVVNMNTWITPELCENYVITTRPVQYILLFSNGSKYPFTGRAYVDDRFMVYGSDRTLEMFCSYIGESSRLFINIAIVSILISYILGL